MRGSKLGLALISFALAVLAGEGGAYAFDPRAYDAEAGKLATCDAIERTATLEWTPDGRPFDLVIEREEHVPIQLYYVDINPSAEKTILMVHGWPAVWSVWGYQIEEFKSDYRLIVPSIRGFGNSTFPGNTRWSGAMQDAVSDLACILKHAGVQKVTCMGHDWGSQICYEMGRSRPDITTGVIGVTIPYIPAGKNFALLSDFVKYFPKLAYQLYFDKKTDQAVVELEQNIRRSLRSVYRSIESPTPDSFLASKDDFLGAYGSKEIPLVEYLTPSEEDYLVEQFGIQGFKNAQYFYFTENRYQSWKFAHDQGNATITLPVLAVYPSEDIVADWTSVASLVESAKFVPKLTTEIVTAQHWIQLENPTAFNSAVRRWFATLEKVGSEKKRDEL